MKHIYLLALVASVAACGHMRESVVVDNPGEITVAGLTPSEALGAVDSRQVAQHPTIAGGEQTGQPAPQSASTTASAIKVEGAQAAAVLAAIDPKKLITTPDAKAGAKTAANGDGYVAPQVRAVVDSGKAYTTRDLALAQLAAMRDGGR